MPLIVQVIIMKFFSKQAEAKLHECLHCVSKSKTHYLDLALCGGPYFCFLLFYFFIHTFLVKFMKSVYSVIKHKMKQKERKEKREEEKKKEGEKLMYKKKKKNARGPATNLIFLLNKILGQKYVLILGYRRLPHLLKIHVFEYI